MTRGRKCRVEEEHEIVSHDGKEQPASLSIYFDVSPDAYVLRLHEYPHVSFYCDKHSKVVQVHESTSSPERSGHSGPAETLRLDEVTEDAVKQRVLKVLKAIYA